MSAIRDPKRYERQRIILRLLGLAILVATFAALTAASDGIADRLAAATSWRWLGLLGFGAAVFAGYELLTLPLSYYGEFHVEHGYGLSNQTLSGWITHTVKEWAIGGIFLAILVGGLYAALWYAGRFWWLYVWLGWLLLTVGIVRLFPVLILPLFYKSEAIENPSLHERFKALAAGTALTISGVFKLNLSKETKKANAMLAGMGQSRRVYLSDTLLEAFNEDEIAVVFAHELGHHVHGHITKGIALGAAFSTITVAAVAAILSPYAGADAATWPAAVSRLPAVILATAAISFAIAPIGNAIMRRFERQSDAEALGRTRLAEAFRTAMRKLGQMNLADETPPRWIEILFHDHPPIGARIASADRWERTEGRAGLERPLG